MVTLGSSLSMVAFWELQSKNVCEVSEVFAELELMHWLV